MRNKLTAAMLTAVLCLSCPAPAAAAAQPETELSPLAAYVQDLDSDLSVSGTTATCASKLFGTSAVTQVVINQTLQRKTSSGSWQFVAHWNETDTGSYGSATNYKYNLADGEYRLLSAFTVITKSGSFENITDYSYTQSVP